MMNAGHTAHPSEWTLPFATHVHRFRIACAMNQLNDGARATGNHHSVHSRTWTQRGTNVLLGWHSHQGTGESYTPVA